MCELFRHEWNRRKQINEELEQEYPELTNIPPDRLLASVYGGNKAFTMTKKTLQLFWRKSGVTVSVLHTGRHYLMISDTHIIYHYPDTKRSGMTKR